MRKNIFAALMVMIATPSYANFELMDDVDFYALRYEFHHNINPNFPMDDCDDVANRASTSAQSDVYLLTLPFSEEERKKLFDDKMQSRYEYAKEGKTTYDKINRKLSISILKAAYRYLQTDDKKYIPKKIRNLVYISCKSSDF
ncbi:MAG: hypothetical protein WBI40_13065 [Methylococcaceae bacterium]